MSDAARKLKILAGVYSFYRADLSEFHSKAWLRFLEAYPADQISKAFDLHLSDPSAGQYLPKPADIVKHLQGTQSDRAALAWSKVVQGIERVGGYQSVVFDEPAIHCAVEDLGGWPAVCGVTYDELPHLERRFCAAYRAHEKAKSPHPPRLAGIADRGNVIAQKRIAPPVLIGNPDAARAVMSGGNTAAVRITALGMRSPDEAVLAMLGNNGNTEA